MDAKPPLPNEASVRAAIVDMRNHAKELKKLKKNLEGGVVLECSQTLEDIFKYWAFNVHGRILTTNNDKVKEIMEKHGLSYMTAPITIRHPDIRKNRI